MALAMPRKSSPDFQISRQDTFLSISFVWCKDRNMLRKDALKRKSLFSIFVYSDPSAKTPSSRRGGWKSSVCVGSSRLQIQGFRVPGSGHGVQDSGVTALNLGCRVLNVRILGFGFRVQGLGFRVQGLGLKGIPVATIAKSDAMYVSSAATINAIFWICHQSSNVGFRVRWFIVQGLGFKVWGLRFGIQVLGLRAQGLVLRAWGLEFIFHG